VEVHRAARVAAAAHGGQVLLTRATRRLITADGPVLEYVGEHRLKDFPYPEPLFHLVIDGRVSGDFPPLRTSVARRTNLREDLRPLVGRGRELAQLRELLRGEARLVTVVGAGGAGKTRLALAAARLLLDDMPVFVASLASIRGPDALLDAITRALDVRGADDDPLAQIAAAVQDHPTLLVLDNFEHLLAAAPVVPELLDHAPGLRVLVTSQAALQLSDETAVALHGLDATDAADLFARHSATIVAGWEPGDQTTIRAICERVGGLPLAIELAAARVSVLAPAELLRRLAQSPDLLRGGARDAPDRHRSLRATFDWTCGLLLREQRRLLRRLGVFAGPAELETIEAVCQLPGDDDPGFVLDALEGLLEFSLVQRDESVPRARRFTMPEALRAFARDDLRASAEYDLLRRRHAEHVAAVAHEAQIWFAADRAARAHMLALEMEINPALRWAAEHDATLYRRLVAATSLGLIRRGQVREALDHTARALRGGESEPRDGVDAWVSLARSYALAMAARPAEAEALVERIVAFTRAGDGATEPALALHMAGWVAIVAGRDDHALTCARESLELLRGIGEPALVDRGIILIVQALINLRELDEARQLLDAAAASITDPVSEMANGVASLRGDTAMARGDATAALTHYTAALQVAVARTDRVQMINDTYLVAQALVTAGRPEEALEAAGAARAAASESGWGHTYPEVEAAIDEARTALGPAAERAIARGANLPAGERMSHVLALAQTVTNEGAAPRRQVMRDNGA
jgi:predicted ATPase